MSPGWERRDLPLCSLPGTQHGGHRQLGARWETPDVSGSLGLRVSCREPALIPGPVGVGMGGWALNMGIFSVTAPMGWCTKNNTG